ncbi:hypothetical protein SDRG_06129 [Saprolegnia diclina VS20]|uniref:FIST C-domain domain-containing protein n=1 Tax=Saprolegnia diclina (strain VS20) TaxID=1156394 RepID=T0QRU1_SAPDV|nr:hypothetical protein SDRG_06129 [Saprolegnia diclina VS20]EQC36695.1 hypothetical protein SDRG_06129 [Saprolegnia diclina VS20]|eukprot:XP_008610116.1 hypothetical protein SDRG_06129 [Saprolegnia diclina VS20]
MSYATLSESAIEGLLALDDSQSGQSFVNASSFGPSFDPSVFESNMAMKNADLSILEHPDATFEGPSLVAVGSAWALELDVEDAVIVALADLRASIGHAHFLVVSYSSNWSPEDIQLLLATHAPDVPYVGGTIARGICDDEAWIAKHKHSNEGLIAIWGVHDPLGTYVVGHTEYDQLSARREVHHAMATSYMSTGATPEFCMLFASPLFIEDALEGARSGARHCPLVGGCATSANSKTWSQISSARGFTQLGLSYCLAAPSVKTVVSWFSGYGSLAAHDCVGPATDVAHKTVHEISGRPAADVYYEWLAMAAEKNQTDLGKTRLPKLGNIHPIGVLIPTSPASGDLVVRNTPVVLDLTAHSVTVSSPIEVGATIALMELSTETLLAAVESWGQEITSQHLLPTSQVTGCLLFMSASVQALLGASAMAEMVGACQRWTKNAPFLALSTYGQIGQATDHGHSTPLYDPLMFASVVFTSESKRASDA